MLDLSDDEIAALLAELDRIIDGDRFPLSPRARTGKPSHERKTQQPAY